VTGSNNPKRYSPEFKDEAAKMMVDLSRPVAQVPEELGINRLELHHNLRKALFQGGN
jgi:transposase-like protein